MSKNVVNAPNIDLKNQLFRKMSEIVQTLPKASECIRIGPNRSERVRTGPNWSEHVQKLQETCKNFKNITENFEKICMELCIGSRRNHVDHVDHVEQRLVCVKKREQPKQDVFAIPNDRRDYSG